MIAPKVLHLFSGLGGGALGFQRAGFETVGAIDNDVGASQDFKELVGFEPTVTDIARMTPVELRDACTDRPDVVFTSPPCKSFSACLPAKIADTEKYREMSALTLHGIWLALEAWPFPPYLIVMENVPRILTRGRKWLDQIIGLLHAYGYAVKETVHDCGELGGLGQHRRRFLLVARHMEAVPEFLYEPPKKPVLSVGEVLRELPVPLPGSTAGGPLHALPRLSPLNWVRLALIPPGGDWRDLPPEVALAPRSARQNGGFGVNDWERGSHTVVSEGSVRNTWASVGDPRLKCAPRSGVYGVQDPEEPSGAVVGSAKMDNGTWSVADPRVGCKRREGGHGVTSWDEPSTVVIANGRIHNGPWQVADPRLGYSPRRGTMRVEDWATPSHVVIGDSRVNKGQSVADPRMPLIEGPPIDLETKRPTHLIIRASDGTWHRPMTTLELAALQGFPIREGDQWLKLGGRSHATWRQRIGNAVPPPTAEAIAKSMRETLEAASYGVDGISGDGPIWVRTPTRSHYAVEREG